MTYKPTTHVKMSDDTMVLLVMTKDAHSILTTGLLTKPDRVTVLPLLRSPWVCVWALVTPVLRGDWVQIMSKSVSQSVS